MRVSSDASRSRFLRTDTSGGWLSAAPKGVWTDLAIEAPRATPIEACPHVALLFRLCREGEITMSIASHGSSDIAAGIGVPPPAASAASRYNEALAAFKGVRPRLFAIAYRMLRSAADAEDVVQDVWVRWQTTDRGLVRDVAAFLATTTTRLAINVMQSARSRRERDIGPWPLEPIDTSADPERRAERGEGLAAGLLLLLEKLSPTERAAYILREAFDYTYRDIANALELEEANARQVVTRARQHLADGRRMPASSIEQRRLFDAFIAASHDGDVGKLEGALCAGCLHAHPARRVAIPVRDSRSFGREAAPSRLLASPPSRRAVATGRTRIGDMPTSSTTASPA